MKDLPVVYLQNLTINPQVALKEEWVKGSALQTTMKTEMRPASSGYGRGSSASGSSQQGEPAAASSRPQQRVSSATRTGSGQTYFDIATTILCGAGDLDELFLNAARVSLLELSCIIKTITFADGKNKHVDYSSPATHHTMAPGRNWWRWQQSSCRLDFQCSSDRKEEDQNLFFSNW